MRGSITTATGALPRPPVSITAEVKHEKEEEKARKGERTLVHEVYWGTASRGLRLTHDVDDKAAIAKYEDGELKLSLPKKREASSHTLRAGFRCSGPRATIAAAVGGSTSSRPRHGP